MSVISKRARAHRKRFEGVLLSALGFGPTGEKKGEGPIVVLFAAQAQARNAHDAHAWRALFTDDAEFAIILGTFLQGGARSSNSATSLCSRRLDHEPRNRVNAQGRVARSDGALAATVRDLRN